MLVFGAISDSQSNLNSFSNLYSRVSINNSKEKTKKVISGYEANPNWFLPVLVEKEQEEIPIDIEVFDKDESLLFPRNNKRLDINPHPTVKTLNLIYNRSTGEVRDDITGQVYDRKEGIIEVQGSGGNDSGKIWFAVS